MSRPPFEVADVIRTAGDSFREQYGVSLTWPQRKVLDAIVRCRTAVLGGHRDQCLSCGREAISYNSCRNRHCPKCQTGARDQWLAKRQQELLDVGYYHLVFSVPHELVPLTWQNKRQVFSLLFEASIRTRPYQMTDNAFAFRIILSLVTRGTPRSSAVAPIILSMGSRGYGEGNSTAMRVTAAVIGRIRKRVSTSTRNASREVFSTIR